MSRSYFCEVAENPSKDHVEEKKSGPAVVPFTPNSSQVSGWIVAYLVTFLGSSLFSYLVRKI